jgi:hypothetical protein
MRKNKITTQEFNLKENSDIDQNQEFAIFSKKEIKSQRLPPVIISKIKTAKDFSSKKNY